MINTPQDLLTAICNEIGCSEVELKSKSRKRELVTLRHIYSYVGKIYYNFTLMSLGKIMGGRDHTTIINSINKIRDLVKSKDDLVCEMLAVVMDSLGLTENDKKNYQNLLAEYNDLKDKYSSLKIKYSSCCHDNNFLNKKIEVLEKQNKLYKNSEVLY